MAGIPMVALSGFQYAGRRVKQGREFDALTTGDARILIAARKADFAPAATAEDEPPVSPEESPPADSEGGETDAKPAKPAAKPAAAKRAAKPKRGTYNRRDMTAEKRGS